MPGGRREDTVQRCYEKMRVTGLKLEQSCCKGCHANVATVAARLRKHADNCTALHQLGLWRKHAGQLPLRVIKKNSPETECIHRATSRFIDSESQSLQKKISHNLRYIFANNVPFSSVISPHWVHLMGICRPGLKPLSRYSIVHKYLPEEYTKERQGLVQELAFLFRRLRGSNIEDESTSEDDE